MTNILEMKDRYNIVEHWINSNYRRSIMLAVNIQTRIDGLKTREQCRELITEYADKIRNNDDFQPVMEAIDKKWKSL